MKFIYEIIHFIQSIGWNRHNSVTIFIATAKLLFNIIA